MEDLKPIDTPIGTSSKLENKERGPSMNETMYREIIGSPLYLIVSRPDIILSVGMCARFQYFPKVPYLKKAKRIIRYLKEFLDMVLFYPLGDNCKLVRYADDNCIGYLVTRKALLEWLFSWIIINLLGTRK